VVLEGVLQCRFGYLTFFEMKNSAETAWQTPSWTTFDFEPGKLKRNLLYKVQTCMV
jgi:hypothetical protein